MHVAQTVPWFHGQGGADKTIDEADQFPSRSCKQWGYSKFTDYTQKNRVTIPLQFNHSMLILL